VLARWSASLGPDLDASVGRRDGMRAKARFFRAALLILGTSLLAACSLAGDGMRTFTQDAISFRYPTGWHVAGFSTTNSPRRLAVASYSVPADAVEGDCGGLDALELLPPDGVLLLLIDYGERSMFPPRPDGLTRQHGTFAEYECFGPSTNVPVQGRHARLSSTCRTRDVTRGFWCLSGRLANQAFPVHRAPALPKPIVIDRDWDASPRTLLRTNYAACAVRSASTHPDRSREQELSPVLHARAAPRAEEHAEQHREGVDATHRDHELVPLQQADAPVVQLAGTRSKVAAHPAMRPGRAPLTSGSRSRPKLRLYSVITKPTTRPLACHAGGRGFESVALVS